MAYSPQSVIDNSKYAILHANGEKHWFFIKDDDELNLWREDGRIKGGDVIVELNRDNVRVAQVINHIEFEGLPPEPVKNP